MCSLHRSLPLIWTHFLLIRRLQPSWVSSLGCGWMMIWSFWTNHEDVRMFGWRDNISNHLSGTWYSYSLHQILIGSCHLSQIWSCCLSLLLNPLSHPLSASLSLCTVSRIRVVYCVTVFISTMRISPGGKKFSAQSSCIHNTTPGKRNSSLIWAAALELRFRALLFPNHMWGCRCFRITLGYFQVIVGDCSLNWISERCV